MKIELLQEPELQFGAGRHVDIRFGLRNYGPITYDDPLAPKEIRLGLVGTPLTIEGVKDWLTTCRGEIAPKVSKKPNLFPGFPGFGSETCFRCDWVTSEKLEGAINPRDIDAIIQESSRLEGVPKLVDLFIKEAHRLCEKGIVDVIVCAPSKELLDFADEGLTPIPSEGVDDSNDDAGPEDEEPSESADFHDMLKARGLGLSKPIQMIRPATYDESITTSTFRGEVRRVQDPATRAWNFHTALYYKAGGTPWRLARSPSEYQSCFIGVSFYRSRDQKRVFTSVAQVFNERGEGMILRGGEAQKSEEDRQNHLEREDMASLIHRALTAFHDEHKHWPARVVVHKTSSFNQDEKLGCDDALSQLGIASRDLVSVSDSFIRLFRSGLYPPLRGTFWSLDDKHSILYTRGSIDFYQVYPGMYVPRTLFIVSEEIEQSPKSIAREILALTKMNWNNTQFDAAYPITIKAARQVGAILKYLDSDSRIQAGYAFYM